MDDTLVSGFVLAGGESHRMGTNKALLNYLGEPLVKSVARQVFHTAGNVTLLGDPAIYSSLGLPVVEDIHKGCGPLGGLHAALTAMSAKWCLLVACDMPDAAAPFLRLLIQEAARGNLRCAAAVGSDGTLQPLCAVYRRDSLSEVAQAIADHRLRMRDLVSRLDAHGIAAPDSVVRNVNTPQQWHSYLIEKEKSH
jgi:molybdenum cofactor guanylyltransferase